MARKEFQITDELTLEVLCRRKGGFEKVIKQCTYCTVCNQNLPKDLHRSKCVYAGDHDKTGYRRCMNIEKMDLWKYK